MNVSRNEIGIILMIYLQPRENSISYNVNF